MGIFFLVESLGHLDEVVLALGADDSVEVGDSGHLEELGPVVVLLEDVEELGSLLEHAQLVGVVGVGALKEEAFGEGAEIPTREAASGGDESAGDFMGGTVEALHDDVELLEVGEEAIGVGDVLILDGLEGVGEEHVLAFEGDVQLLELDHAFADSLSERELVGLVVLGEFNFAVVAAEERVLHFELSQGEAVADSLVEEKGEGVLVHAHALTVGDVEETDALGVVDVVGEGGDLVVDEGAEDRVLADARELGGEFGQGGALGYFEALACVFDDDFDFVHAMRI